MMFKKFTATEKLANALASLTTARDDVLAALREADNDAARAAQALSDAQQTCEKAGKAVANLNTLLGE